MQTPTIASIDVQEGGLCVSLSFSFQHPEFSTPLAERPTYDARLSEEICRADVVTVELAAASAPLLLQAFEQAQSVVERSLMDLRLAQIKTLQSHSNAPITSSAKE